MPNVGANAFSDTPQLYEYVDEGLVALRGLGFGETCVAILRDAREKNVALSLPSHVFYIKDYGLF